MKKCLSEPPFPPSRKSEALSFHRRDGTPMTIATKTSGSRLSLQKREQTKPSQLKEALPPTISLPSEPLDFGCETERTRPWPW